MSQTLVSTFFDIDVHDIVTEDDTPVDNLFSEKQQRLLTEVLYSSWPGPRSDINETAERRMFLAAANVGLFPSVHQPPLVPDMFLSLDVEVAADWYEKKHRSYFFWEFGKAPEARLSRTARGTNWAASCPTTHGAASLTMWCTIRPHS